MLAALVVTILVGVPLGLLLVDLARRPSSRRGAVAGRRPPRSDPMAFVFERWGPSSVPPAPDTHGARIRARDARRRD